MSTDVIPAREPSARSAIGSLWERLGQDKWLRFYLLVPAVMILIIFSVYPLLYSLYSSLWNFRFGQFTTFAGLGNYQRMFTDRDFWNSIGTTLLFSAVVVSTELVLGLGLALLLTGEIRFRSFYRTVLMIPMVLAPVV